MGPQPAFLYDAENRPLPTRAVTVGTGMLVAAPWPPDLGDDDAFAVLVEDPVAPSSWHSPVRVEIAQVEGSPADSAVAIIWLAGADDQGMLTGVSESQVVEELRSHDCRTALVHLAPELEPLEAGGPEPTPPTVVPPGAAPTTASVTTVIGSPDVVQLSLCKIFRWD